ncbi:UAA transporter family/Triose-phosphate Transporter family, putative [Leishmania donovani]|uniref:UAA transporter family/Triose-phosphate Transporter family, putative n=1 Tax=Leishmania donovani TaxID=5661 RepID=A0A3Q8IJU2_LEIDO|nr:UAA transporter family/Triose-phosphate Transporter family, putative [Leishmania donovani]
MADTALGLASIFCGCQANVFLLELIITGSPNTYYALTCAQYVCVALFTLPLLLRFKQPHEQQGATLNMWPLQWRRFRVSLRYKLILAVVGWAMSVGNNIAFGFHISIPLHATFRSSSMMLNMLAGHFFFGKRFTAPQVASALVIFAGLIALTIEKARRTSSAGAGTASRTAAVASTPTWYWGCGIAILVATTACTTALSVFQEHMYRCARANEAARKAAPSSDDAPPMWTEALCFSHLFAIPLFLLQPMRLCTEFAHVDVDSQLHVALNCVTQVVCITGVYVMNDKTSAFTLSLTLTLRKLASFVLSVVYFGHYRHLSAVEWVAMVGALMAGTAYPFLPKAQPDLSGAVDASASTETSAKKNK